MINWMLKNCSHQPIGLDIGNHSIKMLQLAAAGDDISVIAADKVRIACDNGDDDADARKTRIISALTKMVEDGNFIGREVVSSLPSEDVIITGFRLPEMETETMEDVLNKEISQRFGLDLKEDAVNYILAGTVRNGDEVKNELIAFAVKGAAIRNHIDILEQAQLKPVAIEAVPCALFRCFERFHRRQEDNEIAGVFIDIGYHYTTVIFGRENEICFIKQIAIGGKKFNHQIAAKLGISLNEVEMLRATLRTEKQPQTFPAAATDDKVAWDCPDVIASNKQGLDAATQQVIVDSIVGTAEELAREISLCLRYYTVTFRGKRVERATLSGGEAYDNILTDVLKRQLTVGIEAGQPLRGCNIANVTLNSNRRSLLCEWSLATGLALKGVNTSRACKSAMPETCSVK